VFAATEPRRTQGLLGGRWSAVPLTFHALRITHYALRINLENHYER
jgi:hypothetical protein